MSGPAEQTAPATETARENPLGPVSIVIGVFAVILAAIPVIGLYTSWIPAIVTIVVASVALGRAVRRQLPRGYAIAGLTIGILSFPISGWWLVATALFQAVSDKSVSP